VKRAAGMQTSFGPMRDPRAIAAALAAARHDLGHEHSAGGCACTMGKPLVELAFSSLEKN
jgi:hypothetical protein